MNDTMIDLDHYVEQVRRELDDLDSEVRDELTEGLGADLAELVGERGQGALPRPEEYAAELRAAAGLTPRVRRPLLAPDWWRPAWEVAVAAVPVWWVVRAWVWVMLLHLLVWGQQAEHYDVPWLPTSSWGVGMLLWGLAAVVSIQIGRGRLWPGTSRTMAAIVALVALDVATLVGGAVAWDQMDSAIDTNTQSWDGDDVNPAVVTYRDQRTCSLLVFDAHGKRLRDVEIQDQSGRVLPQRNRHC